MLALRSLLVISHLALLVVAPLTLSAKILLSLQDIALLVLLTIALLANIFREMMTLIFAPAISKHLGSKALISAAGVTSMDVLLPSIVRCSGKEMIPLAIVHGIIIDLSVPFFVSLFCSL